MKSNLQKKLGAILSILGSVLVLNSLSGITGFVIAESVGRGVSGILGLVFVIVGVVLFVIGNGKKTLEEIADESEVAITPEKLYMYVTPKSLKEGVTVRGWDPNDLSVAAFDPEQKNPELVRRLFNYGRGRILVEVRDEFKNLFDPRPTGPENKPQGIYISRQFIPKEAIIPLGVKEILESGKIGTYEDVINLAIQLGYRVEKHKNYERILKENEEIIKIPKETSHLNKKQYTRTIRMLYENL